MSTKIEVYNTIEAAMEKETGDLYALNISDRNGTQTKGNVTFSIPTSDGQRVTVFLYPTWVPKNLMEYATRDAIKGSLELRNNMRNGLIALITSASAKTLMSAPGYAEEAQRVKGLETKRTGASIASATSEISVNVGAGNVVSAAPKVVSSTVDNLMAAHRSLSAGVGNIDINSTEAKTIVNGIGSLTLDELDYITANVQDRQSFLYRMASDASSDIRDGKAVNGNDLPAYLELKG